MWLELVLLQLNSYQLEISSQIPVFLSYVHLQVAWRTVICLTESFGCSWSCYFSYCLTLLQVYRKFYYQGQRTSFSLEIKCASDIRALFLKSFCWPIKKLSFNRYELIIKNSSDSVFSVRKHSDLCRLATEAGRKLNYFCKRFYTVYRFI